MLKDQKYIYQIMKKIISKNNLWKDIYLYESIK
jgi:hypothetical protein